MLCAAPCGQQPSPGWARPCCAPAGRRQESCRNAACELLLPSVLRAMKWCDKVGEDLACMPAVWGIFKSFAAGGCGGRAKGWAV